MIHVLNYLFLIKERFQKMSNEKQKWRQILWRTFSETDEKYLDLFRIGYAIGIFAFIVYSGYSVFISKTFDPIAWGGGFAGILFGGGVGAGLRARFEDGKEKDNE